MNICLIVLLLAPDGTAVPVLDLENAGAPVDLLQIDLDLDIYIDRYSTLARPNRSNILPLNQPEARIASIEKRLLVD